MGDRRPARRALSYDSSGGRAAGSVGSVGSYGFEDGLSQRSVQNRPVAVDDARHHVRGARLTAVVVPGFADQSGGAARGRPTDVSRSSSSCSAAGPATAAPQLGQRVQRCLAGRCAWRRRAGVLMSPPASPPSRLCCCSISDDNAAAIAFSWSSPRRPSSPGALRQRHHQERHDRRRSQLAGS